MTFESESLPPFLTALSNSLKMAKKMHKPFIHCAEYTSPGKLSNSKEK
jgi:hypothetical protein